MVFYTLLIAVLIVSIITYFYLTRNFSYWKNKNVPYVQPKLLFGTTFSIFFQKISVSDYLHEVYRMTNFSCMGFFIFDRPVLLARDPELVKNILMNDFDSFEDRSIAGNMEHDVATRYSLLTMKSADWRNLRTRFSSTLSLGKVKAALPLIIQASEDFVHHIKNTSVDEESTESHSLSIKYALDVMVSYAFGIRANSFKNSEFYKMAHNLQNVSLSRVVQSICYFFAHSLVKLFKMRFHEPKSVEFVKHVFLNNIEQRKKSQDTRGDLVDFLIRNDGKGENFHTDKQGFAISLEYITAGYISSGTTLAFFLYELGVNQSIQKCVREEIRTVMRDQTEISIETIQKMKLLDMCMKETARKYPLLGFLDRHCTKTYKIPDTDIVIEKGTPVYISLYGLHNDPRYFPEPEKFDPCRFSPENMENIQPYAYLPFGEGRRGCLGVLLANLTVKIAVMKLLLNFEIERTNKTSVPLLLEPFGFITLPKHGSIELHFKSLSTDQK